MIIHRLLRSVVLSCCLFLPMLTIRAQDNNALETTLDTYLSGFPADYFSGSVLIVQDGEVVLRDAYGMANATTPFTSDTVVDAGSIGKQFTAAAVIQLQSQGLLSVQDTVGSFFPDAPEDTAAITVEQLLTHTSGLTEHSDGDLIPMTRDEALMRLFALDLAFAPGTRYEYSNAGYTLLAIIVEQVSGQTFTDYLHDNLFQPAGLTDTGYYGEAQWDDDVVANGYFNGEDQGNPAAWPGPYWGLLGNGGVLTTVDDLYRWWEALRAGDVIASDAAAELFVPRVPEETDADVFYGYGWSIEETDSGQRIGHNGGGIGGNSIISAFPDSDLLIIILGNRIVYRDVLGLPCHVELPADEIAGQLVENLRTGDFSVMPSKTLTICGG
jgi:CubicO group peptidase (beta-lactamase class C family)